MINNSAGILYTTEIEKDRSPEWIRRHKYTVIPNIIDANSNGNGNRFRKKYKIKEEDIVLGIIGRIHRQKGFELLINALSAVFHLEQRGSIKRIIVAVIGKDEDDYKKVVQRISYQGGIDNRVLFTGVLSGEALDDAFQGIDALVMPSVRESFGNVALEAIANAKPVIIADTIGIAPWVKRNNMGIVLERDMAKWVEVLNDIDNRIHSIDTARGKELVERDYSNNSVMTKFILMYKNIIEEHGK
jgi:glycosyltransferase involved in cell wall biosynthesis